MNRLIKTCLTLSVLGCALSSPVNAENWVSEGWDNTGKVVHTALFGWGHPAQSDYLLEDTTTGTTTGLDGLDNGMKIHDNSYINKNYSYFYGDQLTNRQTGKSGIITTVKDQGTMDVMSPNGNWVRYEYVVFKVKPVK